MDYLTSRVPGIASMVGVSPGWMMALAGADGHVEITADRVSDTYFQMLGVRAALGRPLSKVNQGGLSGASDTPGTS